MSKAYFLFSRLRYIDKQNISTKIMVEKIQSIIGCHFTETDVTNGLAEKRYETIVFGCDLRLEHWKYDKETIYTLSGRTILHNDSEQENLNIIRLNDYFMELFNHHEMPGWYIRTEKEGIRDSDLAGGEPVS